MHFPSTAPEALKSPPPWLHREMEEMFLKVNGCGEQFQNATLPSFAVFLSQAVSPHQAVFQLIRHGHLLSDHIISTSVHAPNAEAYMLSTLHFRKTSKCEISPLRLCLNYLQQNKSSPSHPSFSVSNAKIPASNTKSGQTSDIFHFRRPISPSTPVHCTRLRSLGSSMLVAQWPMPWISKTGLLWPST